jgi:hypothetical protein
LFLHLFILLFNKINKIQFNIFPIGFLVGNLSCKYLDGKCNFYFYFKFIVECIFIFVVIVFENVWVFLNNFGVDFTFIFDDYFIFVSMF